MADIEQDAPAAVGRKQKREKPRQPLVNLIIGIWLFFLYVVTIIISILMLSSYQIQARMQYVEVSGARLSIWRLIELSSVYAVEKNDLEQRQILLTRKQAELAGVESRIRELDAQYTPVFDTFYKDVGTFKARYRVTVRGATFVPLEAHGSSVKVLFEDLRAQVDVERLGEDLKPVWLKLEEDHLTGDDLFRTISGAKRNREEKIREITGLLEGLQTASTKIQRGVFGIVNESEPYKSLEEDQKILLQDAVSEFSSLKNILWKLPYTLSIMPAEILVLFLVLAMGVLGSTIFITQLYFRRDKYQGRYDEDLNMAFFFSRPWFGAITALSIYVLAKAGVLFLTDPSTQSGQTTLSPFFISFIAIISGLFSEQAIQAIKTAADKWFRNQAITAERWGVGLAEALERSGRDKKQFAEISGLPLDTVEAWFREDKPVSQDMQEILSIWLETPVRHLFTDLSPDTRFSGASDAA